MHVRSLALALFASAAACSSSDVPDAGGQADAAVRADARPADDASAPTDGGGAVQPDAAPGLDAAAPELDAAMVADGGSTGTDAACPCTLIEEFTAPNFVEAALTSAAIDTAGRGFARAGAPFIFEPEGAAGEGAYAPAADGMLAPGTHEVSSVDIGPGVEISVTGDLMLRVRGPFRMEAESALNVSGTLTLVVTSSLSIDCGYISVVGDVRIHQPSADGIDIFCDGSGSAEIFTSRREAGMGGSGNVQVWTRGALRLGQDGYLTTGRVTDATARAGSIEVRAYGDIALGPADAYFITGDSFGRNGEMRLYTESRIVLRADSYLITGRASGTLQEGGTITARAGGGIELYDASYFIASPGGPIDVVTEGAVILEGDSYLLSGRAAAAPIHVVAKSLEMRPAPGDTSGGYLLTNAGPGGGGDITVDVLDDITLTGESLIAAANSDCAPGGEVRLRAEGDITVLDDSEIGGGQSRAGAMCAAGRGGDVTVLAGGTVTTSVSDSIYPGTGTSTGTATITSNAPFSLGLLDAALTQSSTVTSVGLAIAGTVISAELDAVPGLGMRSAHLLLSPDGTLDGFVPARDLQGEMITPAARYRLILHPRMFDPNAVDALSVTYR